MYRRPSGLLPPQRLRARTRRSSRLGLLLADVRLASRSVLHRRAHPAARRAMDHRPRRAASSVAASAIGALRGRLDRGQVERAGAGQAAGQRSRARGQARRGRRIDHRRRDLVMTTISPWRCCCGPVGRAGPRASRRSGRRGRGSAHRRPALAVDLAPGSRPPAEGSSRG